MAGKALVVAEVKGGALRQVALEALTAGRRFEPSEVIAVLLGAGGLDEPAAALGRRGADRIVIVEHESLGAYTPDAYLQALLQVVEREAPEVIVFGHTAIGRDVAPRLAARLGAGMVSDAVDVRSEGGEVRIVRPIYAGKAFEVRTFTDRPAVLSIRPNNLPLPDEAAGRTAPVERLAVDLKDLRSIVREVVKKTAQGVDLAEARVVVAGGRGTKGEEGFRLLRELADVLGGAVGASRGACDAGYADYALQIGQTGKVVTPDLYIAAGISGAIQHLAGMSGSKVIVAINKDPEAPIFQVADYGIVGDLFEVVPILIEEFKKVKVS
ncbi:electron transfer flavoprotein subunit alpha/FixB family protein [Hydrogenibacillus sp. N12]|uniref:electron transfer flavoprotein subunit alpha/FixB family protein n=1 Tax=Hydrogenibacillus sp. N12 TaxID=2866627 RepID=UPI001C7CE9E4|nr:electron transfer flavoprotein subunit alpha/FixB family protein [Hydrogenibacillus sp. N12]QZA32408.1 electron transfer flavoprotein subunit alpha/FixB family protein [Hydrogenibacillus sp. N12]